MSKSNKKKPKMYTHKISINANRDKNLVKVNFSPSIKRSKQVDHQTHVNVILAGMDLGLVELLGKLPILRNASDIEREKNIYVFKDEEADNRLYKNRKQMYDTVAGIFQTTLAKLFPDVEYIDLCTINQQETIFEMSKEEAEEYQKEIQEITEQVRSMEDEKEEA